MSSAIASAASQPDTYGNLVTINAVSATDRRYQLPPAPLNHYERHEIEALVRSCERGAHRAIRNYRRRPVVESAEELAVRAAEDQQDGAAFSLMFYSGLRLGELLALRWRHVRFLPDLSGVIVSADIEKAPKSGARATCPCRGQLPRRSPGSPDDYVFCNRFGQRLDGSALRRRYKRAAEAAGLRPIRLHGLRHAPGSVLARDGVSLATIRDFCGHAGPGDDEPVPAFEARRRGRGGDECGAWVWA